MTIEISHAFAFCGNSEGSGVFFVRHPAGGWTQHFSIRHYFNLASGKSFKEKQEVRRKGKTKRDQKLRLLRRQAHA